MMARFALLTLVALASQHAEAFTPASFQQTAQSRFVAQQPHFMVSDDSNDLSIPYDAAARLAYNEWLVAYNKGDFDADRYESFKANYEAISVANVSAKKQAKDNGSEAPRMLTLNEYGDFTSEEYAAMQSGGAPAPAPAEETAEESASDPMSTGDILGKAVDAAQSQAGATSALADASDALAEEEEVSFVLLSIAFKVASYYVIQRVLEESFFVGMCFAAHAQEETWFFLLFLLLCAKNVCRLSNHDCSNEFCPASILFPCLSWPTIP